MELTRRDALRIAALPALLALAGDPRRFGELRLARSGVRRSAGDPGAIAGAVGSVHALAAGLFGVLTDRSGGNLAVSPWSVATALAMTATGARGRTLHEMLGVLAADDVRTLDAGLNALDHHVEGLAGPVRDGEIALASANALFGQQGLRWEPDFLDALALSFGAGMRVVDFVRDAPAATDLVNAWTAARTRDRIPQIIPPGTLGPHTCLVLVNALYFKAPWAERFHGSETAAADFWLLDDSSVSVPMMRGTVVHAGHAAGDGWQAVRLPYAGGRLAMTVVLPERGRSGDVTRLVCRGGLPDLLAAVRPAGVDLSLPRWTSRSETPLGEVLGRLGMATAFDRARADFSGMTRTASLFIDKVLHQVFVEVDEDGTEAAAATGVVMAASAPAVSVTVRVDRPFLFVVHDVEHGVPLFLGRVADPRS